MVPDQAIEADRSDAALAEVCRRFGFDAQEAVLVRRGTNSVYRLGSPPLVIRVAPAGSNREEIERQVAVARWLAQTGVPAIRAVGINQPVAAAGHEVTVWESVGDGAAEDRNRYGSTAQLGQILRRLHATVAPDRLHLPLLDPFEKVGRRLTQLGHVADEDRDLLADRARSLEPLYRDLMFALAQGPIHGDANVGNLLRTADGEAVLSDLDGFCLGPREWDLVLTAIYTDRFGWHTEAEYQAFVEAYGYDLRQWDGYEVLADVRELLMVLWNAGNAATSEEHARELEKRLHSLRTGEGRDTWSPL